MHRVATFLSSLWPPSRELGRVNECLHIYLHLLWALLLLLSGIITILHVCLPPSKVAQCLVGQVPHVPEVPVLELLGAGARRGSRRVRGGAGGGGGGGRAHQHHDVGRRHGQVVTGQSLT